MEEKHPFDVFISYSKSDANLVDEVARSLNYAGLNVWLDRWELVPGEPWQESLEKAIESSSAIAVFVGSKGFGKWQEEELRVALKKQESSLPLRVIPVLLPGSTPENIPNYLRQLSWIDLRSGLEDTKALGRLLSSIDSSGGRSELMQEQQIGDDLLNTGDFSGAIEHYEKALHIAQAIYGDSHPIVAEILNRLSRVRQDQGEYSKALDYLKRSLDVISSVYGEDSTASATTLNNIGSVLRDQGQYSEALEYFQRALSIDQRVLGPEHPTVANRLNNIGSALRDLGRYSEALEYFQRALSIDQRVFGPEHPIVANRLNNIGSVLQDLGRINDAVSYFRKAMQIDEQVYGVSHPNYAMTLNNLGGALLKQGKKEEALLAFQKSLEILQGFLGNEHVLTLLVEENLERMSKNKNG